MFRTFKQRVVIGRIAKIQKNLPFVWKLQRYSVNACQARRSKTSLTGHLNGSWNKGAHKIWDRVQVTVTNAQSVKQEERRFLHWVSEQERWKHICVCARSDFEFSHSQMAGTGGVFILLSGAAKMDNYTPCCQILAATHQLKWMSVSATHQ